MVSTPLKDIVPPSTVTFPNMTGLFKDMPREREYLEGVLRIISTEFTARARNDEVQSFLLLKAPNGSVWRVTVSDVGALTPTKILG
jgi:hypothetical protein